MKLAELPGHRHGHGHGHGYSSVTPNSTSCSGSGSGCDSPPGSEPPPSRQQRAGSAVSAADVHGPADDPAFSPTLHQPDAQSYLAAGFGNSPRERPPTTSLGSRVAESVIPPDKAAGQCYLPPFSDMFDTRITQGVRAVTGGTHAAPISRHRYTESPGPMAGTSPEGRPLSLRNDSSSTGSVSSSSSSYNFSRTPSDGSSLPTPTRAEEHQGFAFSKQGTNNTAGPHLTNGK